MITITQELLEQGLSDNGAYNLAQLKALLPANEFKRPYIWPAHGWKYRLIGSKVSEAQLEEFLRLKNRHLAHKKREMPNQRTFGQEMYSYMQSIKEEIRQSI